MWNLMLGVFRGEPPILSLLSLSVSHSKVSSDPHITQFNFMTMYELYGTICRPCGIDDGSDNPAQGKERRLMGNVWQAVIVSAQ